MIYIIIVLFIEILLNNIINMTFSNLTYMTPLLLVASLNIIYIISKNNKHFIIFSIIIGMLYDILYTNYFLINIIFFLLASFVIMKYYTNRKINFFDIAFMSVVLVAMYDIYLFLITKALGYTYTLNDLIYKINHTCFFNILFIIFITLLLKCRIFTSNKRPN